MRCQPDSTKLLQHTGTPPKHNWPKNAVSLWHQDATELSYHGCSRCTVSAGTLPPLLFKRPAQFSCHHCCLFLSRRSKGQGNAPKPQRQPLRQLLHQPLHDSAAPIAATRACLRGPALPSDTCTQLGATTITHHRQTDSCPAKTELRDAASEQ